MPQPHTEFDWAIYRDATLAGLAVLIPIPLVDWVFEELFRRRMPGAIARHRGRQLTPAVRNAFEIRNKSCLRTCLTLPVNATIELIIRLSRKILYFLTIKEASDKLSYYWHRAFLIDYMLQTGHLDTAESAQVAQQAMNQVLQITTSPLNQLAWQVVMGTHHILRTLTKARRGNEDDVIQQTKSYLAQRWSDFTAYLTTLAARYDEAYRQISARQDTGA
jgi:hypothetical protein